jgi:hypothetical protein
MAAAMNTRPTSARQAGPVADAGQGEKSAVGTAPAARWAEKADDHPRVVARLNDRWRVIDSGEPHPYRQWVLQQQTASHDGWRGRSFCQSRRCLETATRDKVDDDGALARLAALPDRIGERR